jgi:hypothetical protein
VRKRRSPFRARDTALADTETLGEQPKSDFTVPIQATLAETLFPSCKAICRSLKMPKTACLRVLGDALGMQKFNLR